MVNKIENCGLKFYELFEQLKKIQALVYIRLKESTVKLLN